MMRAYKAPAARWSGWAYLLTAAIATMLGVVWFLVFSPRLTDSAQAQEATEEPSEAMTESTGGESGETTGAAANPVVETYDVFIFRDPFQPVRPAEGGTTGTTTGTTTTDGATTGGTTSDGTTTGGTSGPACAVDDKAVCEGHVVELVDVFVDSDGIETAQVRVDGQLFTVQEGDPTFATSFQVLSIDSTCVTLRYGDDMFTLCEGEQVLK